MQKSIFSKQSIFLRKQIIFLRKKAGLTQRELAKALGRERSFVARIELGERRIDLIEFYWICKACGDSPEKSASKIMKAFNEMKITRQE